MKTRAFGASIVSNGSGRQRMYVDRVVRREDGGYENPKIKCRTYVCS